MSNKQEIIFDDGVLYRHGENGSSVWLEDGDEKKEKGVLYIGFRNGELGFYTEEWEGVESKDNKDEGKYEGEI